jgi:hypothetical protein
MNQSQLYKHCLSIVCLNVFGFLFSCVRSSYSFLLVSLVNELIESCRIIYAILFRWLNSLKSWPSSCYSSCLFSIMEWLISEFLITFPFIQSFINELKFSIESSKGIYSIFINSFPYWTTTIISNDFLTLNQLNKFCRCINLGDLIAVLGSIDFVLGSVDLVCIFVKYLFLVFIGSMIGMMIDRKLLLKFFLCYELFFFILSVIMLGCSCEINVMIIVLFLLWNSTFEVVLGLSVLFTF